MNKQTAIELLGGSTATAARTLGVSYQAVMKWPDVLPKRISQRVIGAAVLNGNRKALDVVHSEPQRQAA